MFDVLGQEYALEAFKTSFDKNRISHAYVITGPDGVGKSIFAMHIAAVLLCSGEKKPCGVCDQCLKVQHGNHPDVMVVSKGGKSIGVDDIRDVINEVYTKPYEGNRKVIIIKNADVITVQGQNAILKTLEEPSDDTTIIMTTENTGMLLETILSRCQILKLGRIPGEKIKGYLMTRGIEENKAATAASLSDGVLGNALRFLDEKFIKLREETIKVSRDVLRNDTLKALDASSFFIDNKDNIDIIFDIMMSWFRDIIVLKHVKDRETLINRDLYDKLVEESQRLSYDRLCRIIDEINSTREKLRFNANFQLTVEVMLLNIQEV